MKGIINQVLNITKNVKTSYKVLDNTRLIIGKDKNNQISYNCDLLLPQHLVLVFKDNVWSVQLAPKTSIYINKKLITENNIVLKNGDIIFLYGLKNIVLMTKL